MSRIEINLDCCDGREELADTCLRYRCPVYSVARHECDMKRPVIGKGFGYAMGQTTDEEALTQVRRTLAENT